ncbi:MAG: hypothetical protein ACUVXA_15435 [Candidatus Jordarchaeum sp.]|uniref:hypothetical protein n=1 Tax=Candidatus Jordarchaeum sp. TaxID=2823881 RepID=UPI00404A0656
MGSYLYGVGDEIAPRSSSFSISAFFKPSSERWTLKISGFHQLEAKEESSTPPQAQLAYKTLLNCETPIRNKK